jgi:hypothetical protein
VTDQRSTPDRGAGAVGASPLRRSAMLPPGLAVLPAVVRCLAEPRLAPPCRPPGLAVLPAVAR